MSPNYAVAAARAYEDGLNVNLSAQVDAFLQQLGGSAPSDALYVVEMGGNDIRDALVAFAAGGDGGPILKGAIASMAGNIQALYGAGARTFLVWPAPNVALTPAIQRLHTINPGAAQLATLLSQSFNAGLDGAIGQLSELPGISIRRLDAYALISNIVAAPAAFGLTNVMTACVTPNVPPFTCRSPDDFLFWDGLHPTRSVDAIIAQEAASVLGR